MAIFSQVNLVKRFRKAPYERHTEILSEAFYRKTWLTTEYNSAKWNWSQGVGMQIPSFQYSDCVGAMRIWVQLEMGIQHNEAILINLLWEFLLTVSWVWLYWWGEVLLNQPTDRSTVRMHNGRGVLLYIVQSSLTLCGKIVVIWLHHHNDRREFMSNVRPTTPVPLRAMFIYSKRADI